MNYAYDKNGNILTINDYKNGSQPPLPYTQTFTYDNLDRLYTAVATGGGTLKNYSEGYTYNSTTGNLATKAGVSYTYGDPAHKHAVTGLSNGSEYAYDSNGNMITRTVDAKTYAFGYDSENHLISVDGDFVAEFVYNGDGQRVVATEGITTTVFVGNYFELQFVNGVSTQVSKYYYSGSTRVAMQRGGQGVKYLLGDHLGSASVVLNADGTQLGAQGYHPWGEVNFTEGTIPTEYTFTGQFSYVSHFGMAYFNARWYLPELGRFSQPDTIIPEQQQGTIAWDRHAGMNNNPVRYADPSGNRAVDQEEDCIDTEKCDSTEDEPKIVFEQELSVEDLVLLKDFVSNLADFLAFVGGVATISAAGLAFLAGAGAVTVGGFILGMIATLGAATLAADLLFESRVADQLADYLGEAINAAEANGGEITVTVWFQKDQALGIFPLISYEGSNSSFLVVAPVLAFSLLYTLSDF